MNSFEKKKVKPVILMVDDDEEDIYLTKRAFCGQHEQLIFNSVANAALLFNYLNREVPYDTVPDSENPSLILLDINIPKENGFDILQRLKSDKANRHIPVVMLTTSNSENDIRKAYAHGASSYICKSGNSQEMKNVATKVCDYWFNFAKVPVGL